MHQVLQFLAELKQNNTKEWFNDNRSRYDSAKISMLAFTEILINEIRLFDPSVPLLDPKTCLFRIFRDVRFSHNKTPYKTNMGTFIAAGGRKSMHAGYYFHLEPNASFIGGGIYMPQSAQLKNIRDAIVMDTETYLSIINAKEFASTFGEIWGDKVKTSPRGYDKNWNYIDLIRNKSYTASTPIQDSDLIHPNLLQQSISTLKILYPFNRFLNDAIGI